MFVGVFVGVVNLDLGCKLFRVADSDVSGGGDGSDVLDRGRPLG